MKYTQTKYDGIYSYEVNGKTLYRVRIRYKLDNKPKEHSKQGFTSIARARAYKLDIEPKFRKYDGRLGVKRTLREQWEALKQLKLQGNSWNNSTLESKEYRIRVWLDKFGNIPIEHITKNDVQTTIFELYEEKDYSQETMRSMLKGLLQVVDDAVEDGYIERNKFRKVSYQKDDDWQPRPKTIPIEVFNEFMKLAKAHMRPDLYRCLYITSFGLRRSEVYGITPRAIYFMNNGLARIHVARSRTAHYSAGKKVKTRDSNRIIVLDEIGTQMLHEQLAFAKQVKAVHHSILHEDDFIFISARTGKPFYIKALNDAINKVANMLPNQEKIFPHMLRHMFATYASASGVDSLQLRNFLGHADIDMTNHYTKGSELAAETVMRLTQDYRMGNLGQH